MFTLFRLIRLQFFFFKQKTAYDMRISDWSSDVCSSDLHAAIANVPLPIVATIPLLRGVGIARLAIFLPDALRDYINTAAGAPDDLTFEFPVPALAPQLPSVISVVCALRFNLMRELLKTT